MSTNNPIAASSSSVSNNDISNNNHNSNNINQEETRKSEVLKRLLNYCKGEKVRNVLITSNIYIS